MFPAMPGSRYLAGPVTWYSVMIVTGIVLAILLCTHEEKRLGLEKDTVTDLALWVIPSGIVGARLYYAVFAWDRFAGDPLSVLRIWEGGLAVYGGIIGGLIAVCLFCLRRRISPALLTDMIVPGLALAQSVGRWGNYFNMEAYGPAITDPALQFFPFGVLIPGADGPVWHMATFFYESVWNAAVFAVLWFVIRKRSRFAGCTTCWYMVLYGLGRMLIEGLRTDSLMLGGLRVSQLLSALLIIAGAAALIAVPHIQRVHRAKEET